MTRSTFLPLMLVACWSTGSFAQTATTPAPAAPSDTRRLSDAERDAILDSNTVESAAVARGEDVESENGTRGIHGEVGAMIGSNGTRAAYGTAAVPLGDNAGAVVSFESSRFGGYRR